MNIAIEVSDLTKKFGDVVVVNKLSFKVGEGEIFGLLGPNGAGKTTTIKLLMNLLKPTHGYIKILGKDIRYNFSQIAQYVGYISDEPVFYDKLTCGEFLKFLSDVYKIDNKRGEYLLELFELKNYKDHLIEEYSFGMKRRLSIISALLPQPKVLIIDEPITGLDAVATQIFKNTIKDIRKNTTILMSTHILHFAETLCDKVGIIHKGNLLELDYLDNIKEKYKVGSLDEAFLKIIGINRYIES